MPLWQAAQAAKRFRDICQPCELVAMAQELGRVNVLSEASAGTVLTIDYMAATVTIAEPG